MSKSSNYLKIVSHYESCLEEYGDTHLGVDWPNQLDAAKRYRVMLDLIRDKKKGVMLLDFGCGTARLYDYISDHQLDNFEYAGLDISEKYIHVAREKYPTIPFYRVDILNDSVRLPQFDYIILNGVFTEKRELSQDEMWLYFKAMIKQVFQFAKKGIAFNVMSSHVDWERDDLFHLSMDQLASFLVKNISRDFVIRNDYQLYEYTTYVYRR